ncbi:MAG TPA: selenium cofactor biosynthesis protein YqeC [Tissierellales bacterium]|nr:selenium cofactor biosynthesis protein YqeC [Tissierellales bacterium]
MQFDINLNKKSLITFVGAGGKTSTIIALAQELKKMKKKVLITTTTYMYSSITKLGDYSFLKKIGDISLDKPSITVLGERVEGEKIKGLSPTVINRIYKENLFDFILVEGDGSKGRPIKGPKSFEPVIPMETEKTIGIIGIDCLGKSISEDYVHRPEIFTKLTNKNLGDTIDINSVVKLVLNENGIFKDSKGENILFLNKIENNEDITLGRDIGQKLESEGFYKVIFGSIKAKKFY